MPTRAVLLDIDGVLVVSWKPIDGAVEAVRALRTAGFAVQFLTNTTSVTASEMVAHLVSAGFELGADELTTAGVATAAHLRRHHPGARCLVLNDGPLDDLAGVRLAGPGEAVDVVVIGSGGPSFTWERLNAAARAVIDGAALVGMHGAATWMTAEGICLDGGTFVAALERATGADATIVGKPAPAMFEEALRRARADLADAVMVGDDIAADVLAAQAVGIRGVLVRTGKYRPGSEDSAEPRPDATIDSIADLPGRLAGY
ncbi:MAG: TIGR01458 family HAD-type hydrolase [Acidimicrobiia bacterium]